MVRKKTNAKNTKIIPVIANEMTQSKLLLSLCGSAFLFLGPVRKRVLQGDNWLEMITSVTSIVLFVAVACGRNLNPTPYIFPVGSQAAAVVSNGHECAQMAVDVLTEGGSAADAAITTLFCEGVVVAHHMGLGGGFLMTIYDRQSGKVETLTAREMAPQKATIDMFAGDRRQLALYGGLAVAVPGELKGYWDLHQKYGRLPWRRLVEPTIQLAVDGSVVTPVLAGRLRQRQDRILAEATLREILVNPKTNMTWEAGDVIKRPKLAESLEIIANEGANAIYSVNGSLLRPLVEDIHARGGIINEDDFINYHVSWRAPIEAKITKNRRLYTMPAPGSGVLIKFILDVLKGYEIADTAQSWHRVIEAFKFAFAKRADIGDPDFVHDVEALISNLTSSDYTRLIHKQIDDTQTYDDFEHYGAKFDNAEDHGTAHLCVIAPNGDAISVTSTINWHYGAFFRSPQTGIVLNNNMDDFSTPGTVNGFGVPASPANYIEPGKRPYSSMAPTLVLNENDDVQLVIGAAGGTAIPTSIVCVLLRYLFLNESIEQAMFARRLHHQLAPNILDHEIGFDSEILQGLTSRGHVLSPKELLSVVTAIARNPDGSLTGVYDARRGGSAIAFRTQ